MEKVAPQTQTAKEIRGPAGVVPLTSELPAKIIIDPPLAGRIVQVFGPNALDVSPRIGHVHVTVDDASWHWLDGSGEPVTMNGFAAGPHKVLIELVDANHQVLDKGVVTFVIPQRSSAH
jgi:hypothetical protein